MSIKILLLRYTLQSTSLIRGKTCGTGSNQCQQDHFNPLPSSEGRHPTRSDPADPFHFNPLPSSEGRRYIFHAYTSMISLQSTSLIRGKTGNVEIYIEADKLQSTSLIRGKTAGRSFPRCFYVLQSTSLIRGKTRKSHCIYKIIITSIHFPHPREDPFRAQKIILPRYFNPLPSSEGRP